MTGAKTSVHTFRRLAGSTSPGDDLEGIDETIFLTSSALTETRSSNVRPFGDRSKSETDEPVRERS